MSDMNKKSSNRKSLYIKFSVIFVFVIITITVITMAVNSAINKSNLVSSEASGSKTRGQVPVKTQDVSADSLDGTIVVPENSPIAKDAEKREESRRREATEQGESFIPKTRVKTKTTEDNPDTSLEAPKAQAVNEFGNEIHTDKIESQTIASEIDGKSTNEVDLPLPKNDQSITELEDLKMQLAESKKASQAEAAAKAEEAKQNRQKFLDERALVGAQKLFSTIDNVPSAKGKYTYSPAALTNNIYTTSSSTNFTSDYEAGFTDTTIISSLKRSDGVSTNYGKAIDYNLNSLVTDTTSVNSAQQIINTEDLDNNIIENKDPEVLVKPGETLYAKTTLPIDSDIPGPVKIEILNGKLKGATAFGTFTLIDQAPGVALQVNKFIYKNQILRGTTWALSTDTELPLFNTDVDHHRIYRFGGLMGGLFMSGFLQSLTSATSTTSDTTTTTVTSAISGNRDRIIYSAATAAEGFLPIFYDMANRPVQVKIPKGQEMFLLFEQGLTTDDSPTSSVQQVKANPVSATTNRTSIQSISAPTNNEEQDSGDITLWQKAKQIR